MPPIQGFCAVIKFKSLHAAGKLAVQQCSVAKAHARETSHAALGTTGNDCPSGTVWPIPMFEAASPQSAERQSIPSLLCPGTCHYLAWRKISAMGPFGRSVLLAGYLLLYALAWVPQKIEMIENNNRTQRLVCLVCPYRAKASCSAN